MNRFIERRLMFKDLDSDGNTIVGLASERILCDWKELAGWVLAESSNLKRSARCERSYREWDSSSRDKAHLLPAAKLKQAEPLERSALYRNRLTRMNDFLSTSRSKRIRSLRTSLAVVSALTVLALVCATVAVIKTIDANNQRDIARQQYQEALSTANWWLKPATCWRVDALTVMNVLCNRSSRRAH